MNKIGIMGGTFNPIHMGHLMMAETAKETCGLDKVLFIPSGEPAYKDNATILPADIRSELVKLSIQNNESFEFSDIEIKREGKTYTLDTLQQLKEMYKEDKLYFILGADSINSFTLWSRYEEIFPLCTLLVIQRPGEDSELTVNNVEKFRQCYQANIEIIEMPQIDISSTIIRKNMIDGKSCRYMVHEEVYLYLTDNIRMVLESWKRNE